MIMEHSVEPPKQDLNTDGIQYAIDINERYLKRMEELLFQNARLKARIGEVNGILKTYAVMASEDHQLSSSDKELFIGVSRALDAVINEKA